MGNRSASMSAYRPASKHLHQSPNPTKPFARNMSAKRSHVIYSTFAAGIYPKTRDHRPNPDSDVRMLMLLFIDTDMA
jgi:hypothetical protein